MKDFKFTMGQKVKLKVTTKGGHSKGKIGVITAIYDVNFTPGQYPTSDYRVTFGPKEHGNNNQAYVMESELEPVQTVKAFCFRKKSDKTYMWKSSQANKAGYERFAEFDIEKEILS